LPGVKAANGALDDANPWIGQLRQLVDKEELRGLVKDLRPTIPDLAELAKTTIPFLEESRLLATCFNDVVIPWGNSEPPADEVLPGNRQPVYKLTGYGLTGVSGESRSGDANGQWFRVLGSGGAATAAGAFPTDSGAVSGLLNTALDVQPTLQSSAKTPFRPDIPCETQERPNLNSEIAEDVISP
jgi:hypothetical protein